MPRSRVRKCCADAVFIEECVTNFWRRHLDDVGTLINNRDMRLDCGLEKNADKSAGALTLTTR